jgi:folylpolyglutamate synthase/dihydropteroate synthase
MDTWAQWTAGYDVDGDGQVRMIFALERGGVRLEMIVRPADAARNANATRALAERLELLQHQRDALVASVGDGKATDWLVEMLAQLPDWTMSQASDPRRGDP